jgi:GH24 family phage-related lysozyme (muramidase)/LAS superfamily LD-carboxypeptidase LdcB
MGNGKHTQGRILWLDPNLANNVMVNPEDLSIKVEFNSFRKGRSIIYSGNQVISTAGGDATVGFISGSKVNDESTQPSLTTRYTNAIALEVMNTTTEKADDFESLGIESIDIEFNTAFTPLIKIKFIDVRGNAILSQGNMSKYRMFFELPYPIFSLKVKGFYGGTVNYCLHMQRWNALFNSETGNFEIQADFIGYTYALLTDLLMGLIRASVRTERGRAKLIDKQNEYGSNSNLIISIDDMLLRFVELNNSFKKISSEDNSITDLQNSDEAFTEIQNIRLEVDKLSSAIYDGNPPNNYFRSDSGDVLCVPHNTDSEKKSKAAIDAYLAVLPTLVTAANAKIPENLKLSEGLLKEIIKISQITKKELISGDENASLSNIDVVIQKSGGKYKSDTETSTDSIKRLLNTIGNLGTSSANDNSKIDIYNLKILYYELDTKKTKLEDNKKTLEVDVSETLRTESSEIIGFDPTIRNIFRVLCINAEIFLEVLKDVSVQAQTDVSGKRAAEFKKVSGNLNVKESDVTSNTIYPWPEYREEKDGKGYVETWLGSAKSVVGTNIDEVVFVEEMLKELLNVAKFDKELEDKIQNAENDIDADVETIKDAWYPLCTADTPANNLMTENPYLAVTNSGNVDETKRLILLRAFMFMGISAFNNKIPFSNTKESDVLEIMGSLEAENIVAAARKLETNGQALIATLLDNETEVDKIVNKLTTFGLNGSELITNPKGKKRPIMDRIDENSFVLPEVGSLNFDEFYYRYIYITKTDSPYTTAYIPVNKSFDGVEFYNGNTFKTNAQLKTTSENLIFLSNPANTSNKKEDGKWLNPSNKARNKANEFFNEDDGSSLVKLIELETYQSKQMTPEFGNEFVKAYVESIKEPVLRVDSAFDTLVRFDDDPEKTLVGLIPISGNYGALEISKLNYYPKPNDKYNGYMGEPFWKPVTADAAVIDSSLLSFYTQFKGDNNELRPPICGTFLSYNVASKLKPTVYEENGYINYSSSLDSMLTNGIEGDLRKVWSDAGSYQKQKTVLSSKINSDSDVYLPFIEFGTTISPPNRIDNTGDYNVSLFGSYFYYLQPTDYARAFLFLHCIPWQGVKNFSDDIQEMMMIDKYKDWGFEEDFGDSTTESNFTRVNSIRTMFQANSAFIHAPKAWVLFIGGVLWRMREYANSDDDPIKFSGKDGRKYTLIAPGVEVPNAYEYLYCSAYSDFHREDYAENNPWGMFFGNDPGGYGSEEEAYVPVDRTLRNLPRQVRNEFIDYFKTWVEDTNGFKLIKENLELFKGRKVSDYDNWIANCEKVKKSATLIFPYPKKIKISLLNDLFGANVVENYELISGNVSEAQTPQGNLVTILKPGTTVMNYMVSLMATPTIIQNNNPNIWNHDYILYNEDLNKGNNRRKLGYETEKNSSSKSIRIRGDIFRKYLNSLYGRLLKINEDYSKETTETEEDQLQQEVFGTTDDNTIKLIIYRTLSSINDKWLNGSASNSPFSQCGASTVNKVDLKHAKKYRTGESANKSTLIDTFRFVDRAFSDIGDDFYININFVTDLIRGDYNQSFYFVVNKILTDNNFNFIPLPTFINFNDVEELSTIFTPYNYNNPVTFEGTGPSFVCVFVGQTSVNLDLGVDSVYPDDGLSIAFDSEGTLILPKEASDFGTEISADSLDSKVPVFSINYGQQNQNYFKSIKLDQREFTETMESLQVIESISQQGDKSKPTYAGNNLFNVYQTRSYSAEVEMMGSAMIQPMMYFQLNNIPMFRGAYLIYKVTHNIRPHSMTTSFKGNRVKKAKTPLVDKETMFMNLVGLSSSTGESIGGGSGSGSRRAVSGTFPPIVQTVIDNGGRNGVFVAGNITSTPIPKITGVNNLKLDNKAENKLLSVAVEPLKQMINDWITWMKGQEFKGASGNYVTITSVFRDYEKQVAVKKEYGSAAATPGTSPHGWGMAVDFQFHRKDGSLIPNTKNTPASFKIDTNPAIQWLYDNSYMYGWILPYGLRDGGGLDEHWHFEYHGTAAKCLVEKNPNVYGYKMNTSGAVKSFVKNPKDSSGKDAVYTGCDYKYIKMADGDENSATVGAARENMKVELLEPGFDPVTIKKIIKNGNYAGINIANDETDWIAISANYIAKKEASSKFVAKPANDEGNLRAGYGTDRILVNGVLKVVNANTVFTEQVARETLVYQAKNTFGAAVKKTLGSNNWDKLNQFQKTALVSLTYNTGPNIFGGGYGAQIKEGIESGDVKKAAQGILNGPITGAESGKIYSGLVTRRKEEARLFLLDKNYKIKYT